MGTPLVSVCMPVYNGARFLEAAVRSVLAQTYPAFELLIFDDASMDGSWELLQRFRDPRITLKRNAQNLGPEGNWNQALREAQGKYIKIFHQDDLLEPECLSKQVESIEQHHGVVLSFCDRKIIRENGQYFMTRKNKWKNNPIEISEIIKKCLVTGTNPIGEPSSVLFSINAAKNAGFFDARHPYVIDLDYWIRILENGQAYHIQSALVSFRISSKQWSKKLIQQQSHDFCKFIKIIKKTHKNDIDTFKIIWASIMSKFNAFIRSILYYFVFTDKK